MYHVVMLGKFESIEKIAEGQAVNWAVTTGACNSCKFLAMCEKDNGFIFPQVAPCMKKQKEILKIWKK